MEKLYAGRSAYKKQMIEVKKEYEKTKESELLKEVARLNNLQMALKIFLNSAYGALGNRYFAWFDVNHAEAITLSGQLSIRWVSDDVNDYLNKLCGTTNIDYIVANDTDSLYVCLDTLVSKFFEDPSDKEKIVNWLDKFCGSKLQDIINKSFDKLAVYMNAYQQKMKMKRETIADKGIWRGKKMYILNAWDVEGVRYEKPKLKMSGIEAVRSSTPQSCRDSIKEAISIVMNGDEGQLIQYITNFKNEFADMPF
jgi:DNA polymerase elongation subunit (family B)